MSDHHAQRAQIETLEHALRALVRALDAAEGRLGVTEVAMDLDDATQDARDVLRGIDGP